MVAQNFITRADIQRSILGNSKFRELFPELKQEMDQVIGNPNCPCNVPIYNQFFKYKDRLIGHFVGKQVPDIKKEVEDLSHNQWQVINCGINELEGILNKAHKLGRKQIAIARYDDKLTVVVNDLGVVF